MRIRRAIHKQKGGVVSVPVSRSNSQIRASIKTMIEDGRYNLGIPVVETEVVKLAVSNTGTVEKNQLNVHARKIPLMDIRKEALKDHKNLLRIRDDNYYSNLTKDEVICELRKLHEETSNDLEEMRERLKSYQRQEAEQSRDPEMRNHGMM